MTKRKLLYVNFDLKRYENKALSQINAFFQLNYECYVVYKDSNLLLFCLYNGEFLDKLESYELNYSSIKTIYITIKYLSDFINNMNIDTIYIRRLMFKSILFYNFFKHHYKKTTIYYEIPTYPFDTYNDALYDFKQNIEFQFYKFILSKYIDKTFVICQNDKKVLNNMIRIQNGVDIDIYPKPLNNIKNNQSINFVGIAHLQEWHGYDIMIKSIYKYNDLNIKFYIISEETATYTKVKQLVKDLSLDEKVIFLGPKKFDEIIELSKKFSIGIGSLAYSKRGGLYDTSLKNKEYCALGLPFIYVSEDKSFPSNFKYSYKTDGNIIDLNDVYKWFNEIQKDSNYKIDMYNFAKDNLTFYKYYKKIMEYQSNE